MSFRNAILYQTGEGAYSGEALWVFEGTPTVGRYDLRFSSATAFSMDWTVTPEGRDTGSFRDEGTLIAS